MDMLAVDRLLFFNKWISLRMIVAPDRGVDGYVYMHETRCNGRIVLILPYRVREDGDYEYLIKSEVTPCWGLNPVESGLTGGWEGGSPAADAARELEEESGYKVDKADLVWLGQCFACKAADTRYSLFSVDLTGKEAGVRVGDGSVLEDTANSVWMDANKIVDLEDAQLHVAFARLQRHLASLPPT